jgi:diadenosine tetraphosphate (Ap4A) HIT family hydrolase
MLVVPRRCVSSYGDLTPEERLAIEELRIKIVNALKELYGVEGFNFAWNEGGVAGQSVPHFHLHIVPRKEGDTGIVKYEPREFLYRPGSREASPEEELMAVAREIAKKIRGL